MHNLVKRGPKDYYCTVCTQSWQSPTKAYCPNMRVIAYADKGGLMSKTEMSKRGYKTDKLPKANVCYRMTDGNIDVVYIKLYDPSSCERKKERPNRLVTWIDSLTIPASLLPAFEDLNRWLQENGTGTHGYAERVIDLLNHLSSSDEIEDGLTLTFPLSAMRKTWARKSPDWSQAQELMDHLLREYRAYLWRNRPPLTDEEIEAQRVKEETEAAFRARADQERRNAMFNFPHTLVPAGDFGQPVQAPLFGEQS